MHTIKTTELKVAKHFRRKQLLGRAAEIQSQGSTITGTVLSVREEKSATSTTWVITIAPSRNRATA